MIELLEKIEFQLTQVHLEDIIGIAEDHVILTLDKLAEDESIVDYHGKTRRVKIRLRIFPEQGETAWRFLGGSVLEIRHFCVSPQNHGYGTKFIRRWTKDLNDLGTELQTVVLQAMNERAARFWQRLGFHYHPLENQEKLRMYLNLNSGPELNSGLKENQLAPSP